MVYNQQLYALLLVPFLFQVHLLFSTTSLSFHIKKLHICQHTNHLNINLTFLELFNTLSYFYIVHFYYCIYDGTTFYINLVLLIPTQNACHRWIFNKASCLSVLLIRPKSNFIVFISYCVDLRMARVQFLPSPTHETCLCCSAMSGLIKLACLFIFPSYLFYK